MEVLSSPHDPLDRISGEVVNEESEEEDEEEEDQDLDDCPFEVVPDDVSNGFDGIEEPHERGVGSIWSLQSLGFFSSVTGRVLVSLIGWQQNQLCLNFSLKKKNRFVKLVIFSGL